MPLRQTQLSFTPSPKQKLSTSESSKTSESKSSKLSGETNSSEDFVFPVLYTTSRLGKQRLWKIWVENDTIKRTDGQVGGKLKEPTLRIIKENTLRSAEEQALLKAEVLWIKQLDKDYAPLESDKEGMRIYNHVMEQKRCNGNINRGVKMWKKSEIIVTTTAGSCRSEVQHHPMLAKDYKDHDKQGNYSITRAGKSVTFPCYVQPKLDGVRALVFLDEDGEVVLETRNGKRYMHLNHIRENIQQLLGKSSILDEQSLSSKNSKTILDGELYVHYHPKYAKTVERYQFVSQACKTSRKTPHPEEHRIQYWIYDLWQNNTSVTFEERYENLQRLFESYEGDVLQCTPTVLVKTPKEIDLQMEIWTGENSTSKDCLFEGLMVREKTGTYVSKKGYRSPNLLKYKHFQDEEWEIIGAEECQGGTIKWIVQRTLENGKLGTITAKQSGDAKESRKLWKSYQNHPEKYIGQWINIRYNGRTEKDLPRFPRAINIPEDKL